MAVVYIDLDAQYIPHTGDQSIEVSVAIGNGQPGSYSIFLGLEHKGSNKPTIIGKKADLDGKRTFIITTVRDVLEETNWTSTTVTIREGDNTTVLGPYSKEVPAHKDTAVYTLTIAHE